MDFPTTRSPRDIQRAYEEGFVGSPADPAYRDRVLLEQGIVKGFGDFTASIKDLHKDPARQRVLLFKPLRELSPNALSDDPQDTGDCTSHGSRNSVDLTRACDILLLNQPEEWVARGATELIYSARGHRGGGMNAGRATEVLTEIGNLLRLDYTAQGGPDLRTYNAELGIRNGGSGIPKAWAELAAKSFKAHTFVAPTTVEDALDCMANLMGGHAGSMFGSSSEVGSDGLNLKTTSWNHDMANAGYDLTQEIWKEPVVFVPNSWGAWNKPNPVWLKHIDVLGPWIPGMLVVPLELYDRHIVSGREIYFLGETDGEALKKKPLPDWGFDYAS